MTQVVEWSLFWQVIYVAGILLGAVVLAVLFMVWLLNWQSKWKLYFDTPYLKKGHIIENSGDNKIRIISKAHKSCRHEGRWWYWVETIEKP